MTPANHEEFAEEKVRRVRQLGWIIAYSLFRRYFLMEISRPVAADYV